MLKLEVLSTNGALDKYGDRACFPPSLFFELYYDEISEEVFPFAKDILLRIDKSELREPRLVNSPVFGYIAIDQISNGSKNLIMMSSSLDLVYGFDFMGPNCWEILFEIGARKDVSLYIPDPLVLIGETFPCDVTLDRYLVRDYRDIINLVEEGKVQCFAQL